MKLSTLKLGVALVILVGIYFAVNFFGSKSKSKGVRTELVDFDPKTVDFLSVNSSSQSVELSRSGDQWQVKLDNGTTIPADTTAVQRTLDALIGIKPSRLASRKREKWSEYQVDSTGTEVLVKGEKSNLLNIVLGKLGMTGQRSFHSFVRLAEDDETYLVNNFMSYSVPSDPNSYRTKTLTDFKKDALLSVKFIYPGDSSFIIEKLDEGWKSGGQLLDSAKVDQYLNDTRRLTSSEFYDEEVIMSDKPAIQVEFNMIDGNSVSLSGYTADSVQVIRSSDNMHNYFSDNKLTEKAFVSMEDLM